MSSYLGGIVNAPYTLTAHRILLSRSLPTIVPSREDGTTHDLYEQKGRGLLPGPVHVMVGVTRFELVTPSV